MCFIRSLKIRLTRIRAPGAPSTVCRRLSRQFLSVTIIASVLFLVSCGSTRKAEAAATVEQQVSQTQTVNIKPATLEAGPSLTLTPSAIDSLPPQASYQTGNRQGTATLRKKADGSVTLELQTVAQPEVVAETKTNASTSADARSEAAEKPPDRNQYMWLIIIPLAVLAIIGWIKK